MQLRAILFLAALLAAPPADAAQCPRGTLTGQVTYVRDGDMIVVGSMPIRLSGLAAPEGDEPGGAAAFQAAAPDQPAHPLITLGLVWSH